MYEKRPFLIKIYVIIGMCLCISAGLIYLIHTDSEKTVEAPVSVVEKPTVADSSDSEHDIQEQQLNCDTSSDDSLYRVADYDHPIASSYAPQDLTDPAVAEKSGTTVRACVVHDLQAMFSAAEKDGIELYLVSGYRSYSFQQKLWDYYVGEYGEAVAKTMDAYPGVSEHMLGLSVDLCTTDHQYELEDDFANTDAYAWLMAHGSTYGFILRYPQGSEKYSGIAFSPWSFRYVGKDMAEKITASGKTMEEYFGYGTE